MLNLRYTFWTALSLSLFVPMQAQASRARLLVMGSGDPTGAVLTGAGNGGSYYYDTPYSIFFNPALINENTNFAIIEKSNNPGTSAQGGVLKRMEPVSVALFMNRVADFSGLSNVDHSRPFDLIVGGASGSNKFGVGLSYAGYADSQGTDTDTDDNSQMMLNLRFGAVFGEFEPFGNFLVVGEEKIAGTEFKNRNYMVGLRYRRDAFRALVAYRKYWRDPDPTEIGFDSFGVSAGHSAEIANFGRVYYSTGFWRMSATNRNILPVDLGIEAELTNWLSARCGLSYDFINRAHGTSAGDTTTGRIGMTLKRDNAALDWVVGSARTAATATGQESVAMVDSQFFGFDGGFFTAASVRMEW